MYYSVWKECSDGGASLRRHSGGTENKIHEDGSNAERRQIGTGEGKGTRKK
jgi:hypothetical protein